MGWKGTLRSLQAAQNRSQRDALRRQREYERRQKELARMEEFDRARFEVEQYENYIEVLTSVHKDCGPTWNWENVRDAREPIEPRQLHVLEEQARKKLESYSPGRTDRLLRRVDARRWELESAIERAVEADDQAYQRELAKYRIEHEEWEKNRAIAEGVLAGDVEAFLEVITEIGPFDELGELGSSVSFSLDDSTTVEATIRVNDHKVLPQHKKTLLKSGKLSVKELPKSHFWLLYQDYVCGAVLRVARELFALLPVETVIATATAELLDPTTGHLEELPILSVLMPRATVENLNFDLLDPSDSMSNFVHHMKFSRTSGFSPVEAIPGGATS
jgi:hypothetical protein